MPFKSVNPATGKKFATYPETSQGEVKRIVDRAHKTFLDWRRESFAERAKPMRKAAEILRQNAADYGRLMAEEMGKPLADGKAEAEKCATGCDYFADNAERFLADEVVATDARRSFVAYQPLGVVLAVMPWNFPFWQVFRFAAPALMAGNAAVMKHASNVSGLCARHRGDLPRCRIPRGPVPHAAGRRASRWMSIIENPLIRAVTLTGSTPAGRAVAAKAGEMLKKTVLELGGSDGYLVLDDADVEHAADDQREGAPGQLGPELHRRQALHRGRQAAQGFRTAVRGENAGGEGGRSVRSRYQGRPARAHGPARRPAQAGDQKHQERRAVPHRRRYPQRTGRVLSAHGAHRRETGDARLR